MQPDLNASFAAADKLLAAGAVAPAEAAFRDILLLMPRAWQAQAGLARCARRRGDRQAALIFYEAALALHPSPPPALRVEVASDLRMLGRLDEAEATLEAVLTVAPDLLSAMIGLAHCARQRGDRAVSLARFADAAAREPGHVGVRLELAVDYRELGRLDQAEAIYAGLLAAAPGNLQPLLGLGQCARKRGDHLAALARFEAAAALDPAHLGARLEAAATLRELGRLAEAETHYEAVLKAAPENLQARLGLAHCARSRGDHAAALAQTEAAMAIDPKHLWVGLQRGADLRELGRLAEAETVYQGLLADHPGNAPLLLGLGQCARRRGDRTAALHWFETAAAADPAHTGARLESAVELRELNRLGEAEAVLTAALAAAPDNVQLHVGLGHCARRRGDHAAALAHFENAAAADPKAAGPLLEIAFEQREAGAAAAAVATARRVLALHKDDHAALLSIGTSLRHARHHHWALAAFRAAHEARPARAAALIEMAEEERTLGRQQACDALLETALRLEPQNIGLLARCGEQIMIAGEPQEAVAYYEAAIRDQPNQLPLEFNMVRALVRAGRLVDALAHVDALEQRFGALPNILARRLSLLREAGDYQRALDLARQATAATPWSNELWAERMQIELLAATEAELDSSLAQFPAATVRQRANALRLHGNVAESRWQLREALGFYQQAAALQPALPYLWFDMTKMHVLLVDDVEARRHLKRFCALTAHVTRLKQKSLNISQTHFGQVLDDYSLDAAFLARIKTTLPLPPLDRANALLPLVAENPDSTAAAVSLTIALRQAGAWNRRPNMPVGRGGIPPRITQFWDTEPPEDVAALMQSWRRLNPDHEYQLFSEATAKAYLARHFSPPVLLAFSRVREPAQQADIFRLALLTVEGGIYADADDRCLAPIGTIVPAEAALVMYQEDHGTIGNNFIAVVPRHPVVTLALRLAVNAINRGDTDVVWLSTGPALLTRAFAQALAAGAVAAPTLGSEVLLLRRRELFRAVAIHCAAGYKQTKQHWSNTTFAARAKRPAPPA